MEMYVKNLFHVLAFASVVCIIPIILLDYRAFVVEVEVRCNAYESAIENEIHYKLKIPEAFEVALI